jgi:acyl-CoA thioester hydrolase
MALGATEEPLVGEIHRRVDYSEVDQMGVVYHARYLVWLDVARTELLRQTGMSYRALEEVGLFLVVAEVSMRYRQPARYDDPIRIRTWVRERAPRRIIFGYAVEHRETGQLLATASTALMVLDHHFAFARLPAGVAGRLAPIPDLVRL